MAFWLWFRLWYLRNTIRIQAVLRFVVTLNVIITLMAFEEWQRSYFLAIATQAMTAWKEQALRDPLYGTFISQAEGF